MTSWQFISHFCKLTIHFTFIDMWVWQFISLFIDKRMWQFISHLLTSWQFRFHIYWHSPDNSFQHKIDIVGNSVSHENLNKLTIQISHLCDMIDNSFHSLLDKSRQSEYSTFIDKLAIHFTLYWQCWSIAIISHVIGKLTNSFHIYWQVGNSFKIYWQVRNSFHIYCMRSGTIHFTCLACDKLTIHFTCYCHAKCDNSFHIYCHAKCDN